MPISGPDTLRKHPGILKKRFDGLNSAFEIRILLSLPICSLLVPNQESPPPDQRQPGSQGKNFRADWCFQREIVKTANRHSDPLQ